MNGGAQCWGDNLYGELGDLDAGETFLPAPVQTLGSGVLLIAAGGFQTCAVANGTVECWGNDLDGQLGNNSTANCAKPVVVGPWAP